MDRLPYDGVVLAGGQSRRMGHPKETLPFPGQDGSLLTHAETVLKTALAGTIWVSRPYGTPAAPDILVDESPDAGPLEGIRRGLERTPHPYLAVLAVDLPGIPPQLYAMLQQHTGRHIDVVYPGTPHRIQPLAALWHHDTLQLLTDVCAGPRRVRIIDVLAQLRTVMVPVPGSWLVNVNTPAEWERFLADSAAPS
jgi:molybdopterin-guanine dinucleotide biosynthesis protein A